MKMEYIFVKSIDDYCASEELFFKFLCTNKHIKFKKADKDIPNNLNLLFDEHELEFGLESETVIKSNEIIYHLMVKSMGNEDEQVKILEELDFVLKDINEKCGKLFSINTIWNDVSSYYGKKLYPEISNLENMLRKIIYLFMLKTVGSEWLSKGTPEKVQESIKDIIDKNDKKENEINSEWLMYADFITLGQFFTAPYSLKSDLKALFQELERYKNIEEINNKNEEKTNKAKNIQPKKQLTDEAVKKLSDEYEPKNNWERYFSDKLKVKSSNKFSKDWSSLYNIRNKVAHAKQIDKATFDKAVEMIKIYTKAFEECISIIDTLEITAEEAVAVESVAQQVISMDSIDFQEKELLENEMQLAATRIDMYPSIDNNFITNLTAVNDYIAKLKGDWYLDYDLDWTENIRKSMPAIGSIPTLTEALNLKRTTAFLDRPLFIKSGSSLILDENGHIKKQDN